MFESLPLTHLPPLVSPVLIAPTGLLAGWVLGTAGQLQQASLAALRGCFRDSVAELSETLGTHKKWQAVNVESTGKWSFYELPEASKKK